MRIALLAIGSRGDAQPMVALGFELRRRGRDVVLGLSPNLVPLGERAGVETYGLGPDTQTVLESSEGQMWLAAGDARAFLREMGTVLAGCAGQINAEMLEICRGVDLIIAGILTEDRAQCVAEAQHIPIACVHLAPYRSTRAYPHPLVTTRRLPPMLNLATHQMFLRMWWRSACANVAEFRRQLGLVPDATRHRSSWPRRARWSFRLTARF